jgi:hypothetical protein
MGRLEQLHKRFRHLSHGKTSNVEMHDVASALHSPRPALKKRRDIQRLFNAVAVDFLNGQ